MYIDKSKQDKLITIEKKIKMMSIKTSQKYCFLIEIFPRYAGMTYYYAFLLKI